MLNKNIILVAVLLTSFTIGCSNSKEQDASEVEDKYTWLEQVGGEEADNWAEKESAKTVSAITDSATFKKVLAKNLEIYQSPKKMPYPRKRGDFYYNFWRDKGNLRGVLRRTTVKSFDQNTPEWEVLIDFDKLSAAENKQWLFEDVTCLPSDASRCVVQLSDSGTQVSSYREYDFNKNKIISDGFNFNAETASFVWLTENELLIATDIGDGNVSEQGYSQRARVWKRGEPLENATAVLPAPENSIVGAFTASTVLNDKTIPLINEFETFDDVNVHIFYGKEWQPLNTPDKSTFIGFFDGDAIYKLNETVTINGKSVAGGSVVYTSVGESLDKNQRPDYRVLLESTAERAVSTVNLTLNSIVVVWATNATNELSFIKKQDNRYNELKPSGLPVGRLFVRSASRSENEFMLTHQDLLRPATFYKINDESFEVSFIRSAPKFFDFAKFNVQTKFAISKDGTKVPYTIVSPKGMKLDGNNPTLAYVYGGFGISLKHYYAPEIGANWLENGGVYVLAHVRGGDEYGPNWHLTATKTNKHKTFEDFEAIVETLFEQKVTSSEKIGVLGLSNGGTMASVLLTRKPDYYKAVVARAPVTDLIRYPEWPTGGDWIDEFGDPKEPEYKDYLTSYSPYHNVRKGVDYPSLLVTTTTNDDIVHPSHARKFAAKLQELGNDVRFYETKTGGHYGAADFAERAYVEAIYLTFLLQELMSENDG